MHVKQYAYIRLSTSCIYAFVTGYIQNSPICTLKTKRFGQRALGWYFESKYKYATLELEVCIQM